MNQVKNTIRRTHPVPLPLTALADLDDAVDFLEQLDRDTPGRLHHLATRARVAINTLQLAASTAECAQ